MINKKYGLNIVVFALLVIVFFGVIILGVSYGIWSFTTVQDTTNTITTDCIQLTYKDLSEAINLKYAFPLTDNQGLSLTPYVFEIKNTCNRGVDYQLNLETLSTSTLDPTNIRVKFEEEKIYNYGENENVNPTISGASSAIKLKNGLLAPGASEILSLRLWLKSDANQAQVENKTFNSKVSVQGTMNDNIILLELDTNGGTTLSTGVSVNKNQAIGTLPEVNKEGYIFDGWYSNIELTKQVTSYTIATNDITKLYARWASSQIELLNPTFNDDTIEFEVDSISSITPKEMHCYYGINEDISLEGISTDFQSCTFPMEFDKARVCITYIDNTTYCSPTRTNK